MNTELSIRQPLDTIPNQYEVHYNPIWHKVFMEVRTYVKNQFPMSNHFLTITYYEY